MGNTRNLSALVPALRGAPGLPIGIPLEAIARHLADVGVSVPSALTDGGCQDRRGCGRNRISEAIGDRALCAPGSGGDCEG